MANHPRTRKIFETNMFWITMHSPRIGEYATMGSFKSLVEDNSPFDIKRKIWQAFGEKAPIKLGNTWYENSTPGNIAYGFYGAATGYQPRLLHVGAGFAQFKDAYWDHDGPKGEFRYIMDTEDDYYAVELGITLFYEDFLPDQRLTTDEFMNRLSNFQDRDKLEIESAPEDCQENSGAPYSDDEFINE